MSKLITVDADHYANVLRLVAESEVKDQKHLFSGFLASIKKMVEEQAALYLPKELPLTHMHLITRPKAFISYAWEDEKSPKKKHLQKLLSQLGDDLEKAGISAWLDLRQMTGLMNSQMRTNIETSQYVLIIGTNRYAERTEPGSNTNVRKELDFALNELKQTKKSMDFLLPLMFEGDYGTTFIPPIGANLIRDCRPCFSLEQGDWKSYEHYMQIFTQYENPIGILPCVLGLSDPTKSEYHKSCLNAYKERQNALMDQLKLMAIAAKVGKLVTDRDQLQEEQKRLSTALEEVKTQKESLKKENKDNDSELQQSQDQLLTSKQKKLEEEQQQCKQLQERLRSQEEKLNILLQEQSDQATALNLWAEELEKHAKKQQQFENEEKKPYDRPEGIQEPVSLTVEDEVMELPPIALKKLKEPDLVLSAEESIECLLAYINQSQAETEKARGRDLIVFLGNTGSGKSTAINYLHGCQMESVERSMIDGGEGPNVIRVAQSSLVKELTPIGHSIDESKTFMPRISIDDNFTYCDCPGFLDTRGTEIKIANAANIKNVLQVAKSIKIILSIAYDSLSSLDRQASKIKLIEMLENFFSSVDDIEKGKISLLIGVTQLPTGYSISLDGTKKKICSPKAPKFIHTLGPHIFLFDPLERKEYKDIATRSQFIEKIKQFSEITSEQAICKVPLGAEELIKLDEISNIITSKIVSCFESKSTTFAEIKKENILQAAKHLKTLGYLKIIDHEKINILYQKGLDNVRDFVEKLEKHIRQKIGAYEFSTINQLLATFKLLVDNFNIDFNFNDTFNSLQEFYFEKTLEEADQRVSNDLNKLSDLFFKDQELQESYAQKLQEPGSREHYRNFKAARFGVSADRLAILKNIPQLATAVNKLQSSLNKLKLTTISFTIIHPLLKKQQDIYQQLFRKIFACLETIIIRNYTHELDNLRSKILVTCDSVDEKAEWKTNGVSILVTLSALKENNSLQNFNKVLKALSTHSSIRGPILILIDCFTKAAELAQFLKKDEQLETYKQNAYHKLNQLTKKLEQARDRENAIKLLPEFQKHLAAHEYTQAEKILTQIEGLDDKQEGGGIALNHCIKSLRTLLSTQLDQEHYDTASKNLQYLRQIKLTFSARIPRYKITLDLKEIDYEIIVKIKRMKEDAITQIKSVFNLNKLQIFESAITSESKADDLPQLSSTFFSVAKVFEPLIQESRYEFDDMRRQLLNTISAVFRDFTLKFNKNAISVNIMTLFLVQLRALVSATDLPLFIKQAQTITHEFLTTQNQIDLFMLMGDFLKKCSKDIVLGRHAAILIEENAEFKKINNQLFNAKASKTEKEIFSELKLRTGSELETSYKAYHEIYDGIVSEVIYESKSETPSWPIIETKIVDNAKSLGETLEKKSDSSNSTKILGKLLGYIFGAWTYLDAQDTGLGKFLCDRTTLMQAHPMQAISALLLLGVGHNGGIHNQLIQVKTGEGKSLIIAGVAIALALLGYSIDIGCYSSYLSTRDNEQFEKLFSLFRVYWNINYNQFGNLIESRISEIGNVRQLAHQLLENKVIGNTKTKHDAKRILLIDEVDVFFSDNFLGKFYPPGVWIYDPDFQKLLIAIWENRNTYLQDWEEAKPQILGHSLMKNFLSKFPNVKFFLDYALSEIKRGLIRVVNNYNRPYIVVAKKGIAYADEFSGDISFDRYSYETSFIYIKESEQFSAGVLERNVGFELYAGLISYSELPNRYSHILGVTGTLECLHATEKEIIEKYNIKKQTLMPSLFPKQPLQIDNISIFAGEIDAEDSKGYFYNLKDNIQDIILAGRAVLVVFEDLPRLAQYQKYIGDHPYSRLSRVNCNVLEPSLEHGRKNKVITDAATCGQITLLTRRFGRGSDFICRDPALRNKGGAHVIQTFFSEHESEEVQIKGRTCRQDDKGSYSMILFLADLQKFGVSSYTEIEQFPSPQSEMKEQERVYAFLKTKRDQYLESKMKNLIKSIDKVKTPHENTMKFIGLLEESKNSIFGFISSGPTEKQKQEAIELMQSFQL